MSDDVKMVTVDAANVAEHGFFCFKSKPKSEGYQRKLAWLEQRFAEGMQLKMIYEGKRSFGFVEYIPGEYAWRAVNAPNYLVIHCWPHTNCCCFAVWCNKLIFGRHARP